MMTDTETGTLAGGPPSRLQVATAIADVRARFDACFPPTAEALPMRKTKVHTWTVETTFYSLERAEALAAVVDFATAAPLHDAEEIELAADELMGRLSSRSDTVLNAILEARPSL